VSASHGVDRGARTALVRSAAAAVIQWTVTEFTLRGPLTHLLVEGLRKTGTVLSPPNRLEVSAFLIAPITIALGAMFVLRARRDGLTPLGLGYQCDRRRVAAGALGGVAALMVSALAVMADSCLFAAPAIQERFMTRVSAASIPALVALVLGNGVLVPVVEEFAWRGYIQTRLVGAWSPAAAVVTTAALFALKHVVVDGSVIRMTTLLTGAFALGLIGYRYGTAASTMAHVILNVTGTAASVAATFLIAPP
jgi:membrane protease YdiL (CAAX protease family)